MTVEEPYRVVYLPKPGAPEDTSLPRGEKARDAKIAAIEKAGGQVLRADRIHPNDWISKCPVNTKFTVSSRLVQTQPVKRTSPVYFSRNDDEPTHATGFCYVTDNDGNEERVRAQELYEFYDYEFPAASLHHMI